MKNFKNLLLIALLFTSAIVFGQTKISGTVVDETGEPLPGAGVVEKGTTNGTATDFDGNFMLNTKSSNGTIEVSFVGYTTKQVSFKGGNLGKIQLAPDANTLDEVVIVASGVIDLAQDRKTPIAVTTLKTAEIKAKAGSSDLPELLKSTPSVQSIQGGGFGDGKMFLRGFDQTNTAFLLNGQPINGMEDGKMYWSNWSGVLDIANAVQVQRGLGSSKLAISSVGGTVNIVTKTVDRKEQGFIKGIAGNDAYVKTAGYYSTGIMENGLAVSAMFGHWQGDGYREGAKGQGQTYFLSFGYKPNENHIFNFLVTGAPQWHNSGGYKVKLEDYIEKGKRYNNNFDYINGGTDVSARGRNFYHKPVLNLSWDWTIDDESSLSSVAYGSFGRGGFATYSGFKWSKGQHSLEEQIADPSRMPYTKASMNNHNWFGLVTNYKNELSETVTVNFGLDGRMYNGKHYRQLISTFGQTGTITISEDSGHTVTLTEADATGYNPWNALFNPVTDNSKKFDRNYQEWINYVGAFGQLEYSKDAFSTFFQGSISNQSYQREGFLIQKPGQTGLGKGKTHWRIGYNLKAGASYLVNEENKLFANAGYYSRQPYLDNIYNNVRYEQPFLSPEAKNEDILGLELGYQFTNNNNFTANVNLYHTTWSNKTLNITTETQALNEKSVTLRDMEQVHMGGELELSYKPTNDLKFTGFFSAGDWRYSKDVLADEYTDGTLDGQTTYYLKDVKVGEASQLTTGLTADYTIAEGLSLDATFNYFDNMYGNIGVNEDGANSEFEDKDNKGAIKLPSYNTLDLGVSYKVNIVDKQNLQFRLNVNNVFDEDYIENSSTNIHANADATKNWKGVNKSNRVSFGYGTTWNFGVTWNF